MSAFSSAVYMDTNIIYIYMIIGIRLTIYSATFERLQPARPYEKEACSACSREALTGEDQLRLRGLTFVQIPMAI